MGLTAKDLLILNSALAQYEALMEDTNETGSLEGNGAYQSHREIFGNPKRTIEATKRRLRHEIIKREAKKEGLL